MQVNIFLDDRNNALYQWDIGQRVRIYGVDAGTRVDFVQGTTVLSVSSYSDCCNVCADIPNILLQSSGAITVLVYVGDQESGETVYSCSFRVIARAKPSDYIYTETEVRNWDDLADRVKKLENAGGGGSGGTVIDLDATLTAEGKAADAKAVGDALAEKQPKGDYALKSEIPSVLVQSVNGKTGTVQLSASDVGALPDDYTPPEAPVQSVNGKTGAVKLAAEDVGALPASTKIPSKTSELTNDSEFLTGYTETDPTVPAWAKAAQKPTYTAAEVGADPSGAAASAVAAHNVEDTAHSDIRALIKTLTERLNALADSDDATLDQMSELVAYIKANRELVEQVTTAKVSVSDVVDNLVTNDVQKPLSAAQGVALKALIDAITVPTKVSELANDSGYLTEHQDISGKLDADKLPEAVNTALAQAKASGEFDGEDGTPGSPGKDGVTPTIGANGNWYIGDTDTGKPSRGETGAKGADGKTPVKGTDYWTEADQEAIVQQVIAALGTPVFGTVDENKVITLSGELAEGVYTLRYENADGSTTEIGSVTVGGAVAKYTNQIPISTDSSGNVYNTTGYKEGKRMNSSGAEADLTNSAATNPTFITGFIPVQTGDIIRLKNCYISTDESNVVATYGEGLWGIRSGLYDSAKAKIEVFSWGDLYGGKTDKVSDYTAAANKVTEFKVAYSGVSYIRLTLAPTATAADAIVTVNEPIE